MKPSPTKGQSSAFRPHFLQYIVNDNALALNLSPLPTALQTNAVPIPISSPTPGRQRGRPARLSKNQTNGNTEMKTDNINPNNVAELATSLHIASSTIKILKEVAIPLKTVAGLDNRAPSPSLSTASSALSRYREYSNDYETPETSVAVTPAESIVHGRKINPLTIHKRVTTSARRTVTNASSLLGGKGKRKRTKEDDEEEDFLFAQSLQAEEYAATETTSAVSTSRARGRNQRFKVPDSEEELDENIDISSDAEFKTYTRASALVAESAKGKHAKLSNDSFLPSRAARDSAKKSIAKSSSLAIPGTEDEEDDDDLELSEYELDQEFEEDDEAIETASADLPLPSTNASGTLPTASHRAGGSRVTTRPLSDRGFRRLGSRRVSQLGSVW